jgi:hypothetical protein
LLTGKWSCLVPVPGLVNAPEPWSACYFQKQRTVVLMHMRNTTAAYGTGPDVFIHRIGKDSKFIPVPSRGDVPDGMYHGYLTALPGGKSALAFQKTGIFELKLEL